MRATSVLGIVIVLIASGCEPLARQSTAPIPSGSAAAPASAVASPSAIVTSPSEATTTASPDVGPVGSGIAGTTDAACATEDRACFEKTLRDAIALADRIPTRVEIDEPETFAGGQRTSSWVAYMVDSIVLVNTFWANAFAAGGVPYTNVNYVVIDTGQPDQASACVDGQTRQITIARANAGPFYCYPGGTGFGQTFQTGTIYIGIPLLVSEASKVNPRNYDFAIVSIVAHEFGHHVESQLFYGRGWYGPTTATWWELGADCLAGVFAHNAYFGRAGRLTDTDVGEAMQMLYNWGNDLPYDYGRDTHGSRQQRVDAFLAGYNNGSTSGCLAASWPTGF